MAQPLWLRAFNAAEGAVGPRVETLVHGSKFSKTVVLVHKVRAGVGGVVERRTRQVWHLVNLPAGSDVRSLRGQLGDLDHEVRQLRSVVESEARKRARKEQRAVRERSGSDDE